MVISLAGFPVLSPFEFGEFLFAHRSSQNHYRGQAAGDDQAKQYGGRDNFKLLVVL